MATSCDALGQSRAGSVRAFFRGNGANVVKIAPETALKLMFNDKMKVLVVSDLNNIRPHERMFVGAIAGASAQAIIYPLELIRTRLAVSPAGHYRGILHCLILVLQQEGWRAFYRGMLPCMIGILPYSGVDIATFEILKQRLLEEHDGRPPPPAVFAAGMLSSCVAQCVSYPLALIRTRLQAQGMGGSQLKYHGMVDVIRKTVAREGFLGLYKGVLPNLIKVAPAAGISWFTFEEVKRILGVDVNT